MGLLKDVARLQEADDIAKKQDERSKQDVAKFKTRITMMQERVEFLNANLKKDSQFRKLVERINGDVGIIDAALKALNSLADEISELEMDTITQDLK